MKKMVFWIGVIVLVIGIVLFGYGYITIQNIRGMADLRGLDYLLYANPTYRQQWDMAQVFEPLGLGILVLGVIMLAYGLLKK